MFFMDEVHSFEEQYMSPADRIKDMILRRWGKAEDFYDDCTDVSFSRAVRSMARLFSVVGDKTEREVLRKLAAEEDAKLALNRTKSELTPAAREKEEKELLFKYAEDRLDVLSEMLAHSPVIQKDVEIDFVVPKTLDACETVRDMVQKGITMAELNGEPAPRVLT